MLRTTANLRALGAAAGASIALVPRAPLDFALTGEPNKADLARRENAAPPYLLPSSRQSDIPMTHQVTALNARRAQLVEDAIRIFGNEKRALLWLNSHSVMLRQAPLDLISTEDGFQAVQDELVRIDYGDLT